MVKRILVLHGNRQTGQLLLGRLDRVRKRASKEFALDFVAPDAPCPHPDDDNLRSWWNRVDNTYEGLDSSLNVLKELQHQDEIVGIMGFSQGARLAHLVSMLHMKEPDAWFPNLAFVVLVAGYDAPLPDNFSLNNNQEIRLPSLHVWGRGDKLVTPDQSQALSEQYFQPTFLIHDGNHYVPTKAPQIQAYIDFIREALESKDSLKKGKDETAPPTTTNQLPDEETTAMQEEEIQALEAIFFEEIDIESATFPIRYRMKLVPTDDEEEENIWPPHLLTLEISYPYDYPLQSIPNFRLLHENNVYEFRSARVGKTMSILKNTAREEIGMPSVLSCIYAVKDYLDSPASENDLNGIPPKECKAIEEEVPNPTIDDNIPFSSSGPRSASPEEITKGILEGLEIAERILMDKSMIEGSSNSASNGLAEKGGAFWTYTIGLVGKPSAGKSTFFNAASAFSKQRGVSEGTSEWGGASVAAHPFTTIDPNIGYCLVPAPVGSCPEDDMGESQHKYGSTHGRDPNGRRLLPILLKDVAGLVPGAYQGRGKGNRFLNDLCDATVLVHVVDASGTADAQGNTTGGADLTNPLDDMQWIRSELVEWVYGNVAAKWDTISRKGRKKLSGMFSGYGQSQALTERIFLALEKFLEERYAADHVFESIEKWDEADVHRLVSAFLGVRFPMALALNKYDLPTSAKHVREIQKSLPIHGAHVATPLTAKSEMNFVKDHLMRIDSNKESKAPSGVWQCLTSAIKLREPVLVFPVSDMSTYAPLSGLNERSVGHPSLPSVGMIRCIDGSGGVAPTSWNELQQSYLLPSTKGRTAEIQQLRDVIPMKPGSSVADVFLALKNNGALGGEFVRAEAAGNIGEKPKPIPKTTLIGKQNRILKIMTSKRTTWQS